MTTHPQLLRIAALCLCAFSASAWSQDAAESETKVKWGISGGYNHYTEPKLMQLQGPEAGLHFQVSNVRDLESMQFEGDILLGAQHYTSTKSGTMSGVPNLENRYRAFVPVSIDAITGEGFYTGLAVHTLWNNLRQAPGGYERSATQLWLPLRWHSADAWDLDAGLLMYGRHSSKLSQAVVGYTDIVNTQHKGQYAQFSMSVPLENGDTLKPFVRYTHLADSDRVVMGGYYWIEPESQRWQVGAVWEFNSR
jgi:hypothetical protein